MAKVKKLLMDEALREFRIKTLTSPPAVIEMSTLDKEMSDILSRNDLPKEVKIKKYHDALNKFRTVRDMVTGVEPVQLNPPSSDSSEVINLHSEKGLEKFGSVIKNRIQNTFLQTSDGKDVYDGSEKIGSPEDLVNAIQYFLNIFNPDDSSKNKSSMFFDALNPVTLPRVREVILDVLKDENVDEKHWKSIFPRLSRTFHHDQFENEEDLQLQRERKRKKSSKRVKSASPSIPMQWNNGSSANNTNKVPDEKKKPTMKTSRIPRVSNTSPSTPTSPASAFVNTTLKKKKRGKTASARGEVPLLSKISPRSMNTTVSERLRSNDRKPSKSKMGNGIRINFDTWNNDLW